MNWTFLSRYDKVKTEETQQEKTVKKCRKIIQLLVTETSFLTGGEPRGIWVTTNVKRLKTAVYFDYNWNRSRNKMKQLGKPVEQLGKLVEQLGKPLVRKQSVVSWLLNRTRTRDTVFTFRTKVLYNLCYVRSDSKERQANYKGVKMFKTIKEHR